jgi:hypothetical protein
MPLSKKDKEFRLPKISYLDFKYTEMDRVLTNLFGRLQFNGLTPRVERIRHLEVQAFVDQIGSDSEDFVGFDRFPLATRSWVETHLMDMVNRGKTNQAIAAPRPLHGYTYRFRNPKHSRDYGAAQQIYETLFWARGGQAALEQLKRFFFEGLDPLTGRSVQRDDLDVETQALLSFSLQVKDTADDRTPRESYPPICLGGAGLMAEDIQRLLFYRDYVPRTVMVEYVKILLAFHLALGQLRLMKLLPALVARGAVDPICTEAGCPMDAKRSTRPQGDCPHRIGLFLDVGGRPDTPVAELAVRSADAHLRRIPPFVKAYLNLRKLDEFSHELRIRHRFTPRNGRSADLEELISLLGPSYSDHRKIFFGQRMSGLIADCTDDDPVSPQIKQVMDMDLPEMESYIECLMSLRGEFHRKYITEALDSLMLKNRPGAFIAQQRTKGAPRRFILDSRLLEVLLQIVVLRPGGTLGYHTEALRVDEVLDTLRDRYGLHIDRLPPDDGFTATTIMDRKALRANRDAFLGRLREVGYFRDLSDAYVAQTVTPRYRIDPDGSRGPADTNEATWTGARSDAKNDEGRVQ